MELLRRETLGDQVYRVIRRRILEGRLEPGRRITQTELADEMGVSRIPVRDALRRLDAEELLAGDELGRYTVVTFEVDDAKEVYAIRRRLGTLALELAMDMLSAPHLERLRSLVDEMGVAVRAGQADDYIEMDRQFHFNLYEASGSPRLVRMIKTNWGGIPHPIPIKIFSRMQTSHSQHQFLLERIAAGDKSGAVGALDHHIESAFLELTTDCQDGATMPDQIISDIPEMANRRRK